MVLTFTLSSVNQHSGWTYLKNSLGFIRISMEASENVWQFCHITFINFVHLCLLYRIKDPLGNNNSNAAQ